MTDLDRKTCSCGYPIHLTVGGVCPRCKSRESSPGIVLKEKGMSLAARNKAVALSFARGVAVGLAMDNDGLCNMDMVNDRLDECGIKLGPAAGSVFACNKEWMFTGDRILSKRTKNHARELKIWRLRRYRDERPERNDRPVLGS